MGVDIHYLAKQTKLVSIDGVECPVGAYAYMSRYNDFSDALNGRWYSEWERKSMTMLKARIARIEQGWEVAVMPAFVVITNFKEESLVYRRDNTKASAFWVDTTDPGEVVGMLRKVGCKWVVVPEYKCWHCKDTGVAKYRMSRGDMMWVEGMVCSCNPAGNAAAEAYCVTEEARTKAANDRMVWERAMAAGQKASLDACCL